MTTMRAGFRSIFGIDKENWSSFGLSLILNKLSELIKTPVVKYSSLFLSGICGLSNVGQVLHGNGKSRGTRIHNLPGNVVIDIPLEKPAFCYEKGVQLWSVH